MAGKKLRMRSLTKQYLKTAFGSYLDLYRKGGRVEKGNDARREDGKGGNEVKHKRTKGNAENSGTVEEGNSGTVESVEKGKSASVFHWIGALSMPP